MSWINFLKSTSSISSLKFCCFYYQASLVPEKRLQSSITFHPLSIYLCRNNDINTRIFPNKVSFKDKLLTLEWEFRNYSWRGRYTRLRTSTHSVSLLFPGSFCLLLFLQLFPGLISRETTVNLLVSQTRSFRRLQFFLAEDESIGGLFGLLSVLFLLLTV